MSSVKLFIFYHQNYHYHQVVGILLVDISPYIGLPHRPPLASFWKLFASTENARYYLGHSFTCWWKSYASFANLRSLFESFLISVCFVKNNLKTYQVFDRLIGHQPIATAPALGARAPIEEHVLLTRVAVVVAVHQR